MQWFPPRAESQTPPDGRHGPSAATSRLWYRALLSTDRLGAHHVPIIGEHFVDALDAAQWPLGACLILVGGEALFFSPASVAAVPHLIVACEAAPSPPPDRSRATLVAGRQSDLELLPHKVH